MTYPQPGGDPQAPYPGYPNPGPGYPPGQPVSGPGYPVSGQPGYPPGYPVSGQPGYPAGPPASGPGYPSGQPVSAPGYPTSGPGYGGAYPPAPGPVYPPGPQQQGYQQPGYGFPGQTQVPPPGYAGYAGYAPSPMGQPSARPGSVTAAAMLMLGIPVLQVISLAVSMSATSAISDNLERAYADVGLDSSSVEWSMSASSSVSGIISLVMALVIGVLALFNLRGANGARVTTWVLCGLGILMGMCGLAGLVTIQSSIDSVNATLASSSVYDILPSWYLPTSGIISVLCLSVYIAVTVLLARPSANAFFRGYPYQG